MIEILFSILMVIVFGKLLVFSIRAAWGMTKILFSVALLPVILVVLVFAGLMYIAFPVLIIIGIVSWFCRN